MKIRYASIFLIAVLASCTRDPEIGLGRNEDKDFLSYTKVDTVSVEVTLEAIDSVDTDRIASPEIGRYKDPVFGIVESASVFEVLSRSVDEDKRADFSGYTLDSCVLQLRMTDYRGDAYPYDDFEFHFQVEEVAERISASKTYFSNYDIPVEPTVLGSIKVNSLVEKYWTLADTIAIQNVLRVPISDDLGNRVLGALQDNSVYANEEFLDNTLKGLKVSCINDIPDGFLGALFRFDLNNGGSHLELHLSSADHDTIVNLYTGATSEKFTQIRHNYTGSEVDGLFTQKLGEKLPILSDGLKLRVKIPHIRNILNEGRFMVSKGVLSIPYQTSNLISKQTKMPTPTIIFLGDNDGKEVALSEFVGRDGVYRSFQKNEVEETYDVNMPSTLNNLLFDEGIDEFIIKIEDVSAVSQLILNGASHSENPLKLELHLTEY